MGNITDERTSQSDIEQVKERVQDVAEQAKEQTRDQLRAQIDTRTTQAGEQVSSTARAFRKAGDQLRRRATIGPPRSSTRWPIAASASART